MVPLYSDKLSLILLTTFLTRGRRPPDLPPARKPGRGANLSYYGTFTLYGLSFQTNYNLILILLIKKEFIKWYKPFD